MHICIYTETALPKMGGQEMVVDALARQFLGLGHAITVLTQQPRRRYRPNDGALPYPVVRHPRFFSTRYFVSAYRYFLHRLLRRAAPPFDVLHCHGLYPSGYLAALLKPHLSVPILLTSHGGDVYEKNVRQQKPVLSRRHELAVRSADRLVAISPFTAAGFLRLGAREQQIVTIPNGVHLADFAAPAGRPADLDARIQPGRFLLFIGRLVRRKGVDVLLRAFAQVAPAHAEVRLVIAGDGVERQALQALAQELGLGERVSFLGAVQGRTKTYLFQSTLGTIVPSRGWEAFGLVVLESYAAGKPVIASRHPGLDSLVQENRTGLLVRSELPDHLAAAIGALLADPARTAQMGQAAQSFVQGFAWRAIAQRHIELYQQLAGSGASSGLRAAHPAA
jgi:glycosyltransferase involved in cell wall biosynthesis